LPPGFQLQLFHGIHLPNLVGALRDRAGTSGFAARRRGRLPLPAEPALQRARTGQMVEVGVQALQANEQKRRTPRRMFLMQQERLLDRPRRRRRLGTMVRRFERFLAERAQATAQMTNRARAKAKLLGDGRRGKSLLHPSENSPAHLGG
jgi:hypothetical protein